MDRLFREIYCGTPSVLPEPVAAQLAELAAARAR
jgi:hypothetical protein